MIIMKLWYENYAKEWTQALPIGNGHIGAMAYGGAEGKFDLSENTCWSGAPQEKYLDDNAGEYMRQARSLLTQKKIDEAEELVSKCCGINESYGTQVPMGRLFVSISQEPIKTYRELDLLTGVCIDKLNYENSEIKRESFISNPQKVMCVKLSTDSTVLPQLSIWVEGWNHPTKTDWMDKDLIVKGRALENIHSDGLHGVEYTIRLRMVTDGKASWSRKGIHVENATNLTLYLTAATDMFDKSMEEHCKKLINNAENLSWEKLFTEHCSEHSEWMSKCELVLPKNRASQLPTDKRIQSYKTDKSDYDLESLFFQYGRYLMLNSSRPDSLLPAALQGVWNDDRACRMGWTDDMHLDINTQMNYYPAEVTGLSECTQPLFDWINDKLMPNGERIAKELYGSQGWVAHTISNAYGWAAPGWGGHSWAFHVSGGGWVSSHIWEHYLYTKDKAFLNKHFKVLYGTGKFLFSLLTENPETSELVTNPSYSPENAYIYNGKVHTITTGATIDTIVTKYTFNALINGAQVLECEDEFIEGLKKTIKRLPEFKIGEHGQLLEWNEDFEEAMPDHRHTSHLLSMHPFNLINPDKQPELKAAVKTTLSRRLGENAKDIVLANWSGALLILYNARLLEGDLAGEFIKPMIAFLSRENMMITHEGPTTSETGGIYELDGNTGFTAGVAEMLLQSYSGELHVLPAISHSWHTGSYKGLVAQGGHKVDVKWDEQRVNVTLHPNSEGSIIVRYQDTKHFIKVRKSEEYKITFEV